MAVAGLVLSSRNIAAGSCVVATPLGSSLLEMEVQLPRANLPQLVQVLLESRGQQDPVMGPVRLRQRRRSRSWASMG